MKPKLHVNIIQCSRLIIVSLGSSRKKARTKTSELLTGEVTRLQNELMAEHERVQQLSAQLATNAQVVSAFEQSMTSLTNRLTQVTEETEIKVGTSTRSSRCCPTRA